LPVRMHPVTLRMGSEPPLPVRMGAKHSVTTLRIGSEPPLPVRMGAKHSVTLNMGNELPMTTY
jgi:hypothetical protein